MSATMEVSQEALETIGNYVRRNFRTWFEETVQQHDIDRELEQRERWIRTEQELKSQRELMMMGFEQMEKRLEQIDKRFEQVDKRFEQVDKRFEQVDKRFEQVDKQFEQVNKQFERVDRRFAEQREDFTARFDDMHRHMNRWMTVLSLIVAVVGVAVTVTNVI